MQQGVAFLSLGPLSGFLLFCIFALALGLCPPAAIPSVPPQAGQILRDMTGVEHTLGPVAHRRLVFAANIMPAYVTIANTLSGVVGATKLGSDGMFDALLNRIFPEIRSIPSAGTLVTLDRERILKLAPDVLLSWQAQAQSVKTIGFRNDIIFQSDGTLATEQKIWTLSGQIAGEEERAAFLLERGKSEIAKIGDGLSTENKPRVLILVSGINSVWLGSERHMMTARLRVAGGENVIHQMLSPISDIERVAEVDPDIILISTAFANFSPAQLYSNVGWQAVRAVRMRNVYLVPTLPGFASPIFDPLLVEWLAELLHPDETKPLVRTMIRNTYGTVYGYSCSEDDIDNVLNISANHGSVHGSRFERPN